MRAVEVIEMQIRNLGREIVPDPVKTHLWYRYQMVKKVLETKRFGLFATAQIEVNTDCNRRCSYCPNSRFPKKPVYMDEDLFQQIIDELKGISYQGRILPHCVNEPLEHPKLPQLIATAREAEKSRIEIFTNGDSLNRERFDELRKAGANAFVITQHGKNTPPGLKDLLDSLTNHEQKGVTYRKLDPFHLFNRGIPGLIEPRKRAIPDPCFIADYYLQILVNGDIVQCCNDFRGEHVFGNIKERSIMDIWNDTDYKVFRNEVRHGQFKQDLCQRCVFDTPKTLQG
jgi:radical SAM protein with 4Fe4S-binding SPASM domain